MWHIFLIIGYIKVLYCRYICRKTATVCLCQRKAIEDYVSTIVCFKMKVLNRCSKFVHKSSSRLRMKTYHKYMDRHLATTRIISEI